MLVYLLGAMVLCIAALVFLLPHSTSSAGKKGGVPAYNITNINNPSTTIGPSTSNSQSGHTTTVTSSKGNQTYQQAVSSSYSTTTILYVYCIGSPTPSFNQSYYSQLAQSGAVSWKTTTSYPIPFLDGSCASSGSYVYCVGDSQILFSLKSTQAYYAPLSSKGVGNWQQTTSYPVQFNQGSCAAYNNYIYCVGTFNSLNSKKVFYAPISSSGIGNWSQTTDYPAPFNGGQCNAYNGYIYCIGDTYINASALAALYPKSTATNSITVGIATANQEISGLSTSFLGGISYDYYAPLTASGVGQWKRITPTPQPVDGGACTISSSTIYCMGGSFAFSSAGSIVSDYGAINSTTNVIALISALSDNASAAFYATIGANGAVGSWTTTSSYPTQLQGTQCASNGMNIYCIGGSSGTSQGVFYANLVQGAGIGSWKETTDYPIPFYSGYCSTNANA
jgi:hypothetical protein